MKQHRPILQRLIDAGHEAYFVGGCVRDYLLNRPCKDIDICTSATPDQVAELFPESKLVGAHFGVVIVKLGDLEAEVATFRTDGCYSDSRRPDSVVFTKNVREDLLRRDFTINTLMMDIHLDLVDKIQGELDLDLGVIRCVGYAGGRFKEDALRMLRAVRFSAQLGFTIAPDTFWAIRDSVYLIEKVSPERVQIELNKILTSGRVPQGIEQLKASGLLQYILPEVVALKSQEQNPVYHPEGDVYTHTLGLLEQLPAGCSLTLALAALLHDVGKPATYALKDGQPTFHGHEEAGAEITGSILRRLKYPNEVIEVVVSHVANHMTFRYSKDMRRAKLLRFVRQDNFEELLQLHKMDATAGSGNLSNYEHCLSVFKETPPEIMRPVRLVTGFDLVKLGLSPSPFFKAALEYVETLQLEGRVNDRSSAMFALQAFVELNTFPEVRVA